MEKEKYVTQDLSLVITLKALGFSWVSVSAINYRVTFTFEMSPALDGTINKYHLGELKVEPSKLFSTHRVVKKLVREVGREVTHG